MGRSSSSARAKQAGVQRGRWAVLGAVYLVVSLLLATSPAVAASSAVITLSPKIGPPTAKVNVKGSGFGASEAVVVDFDTTKVATATTDPSGSLAVSFKVPRSAAPGHHTVTATGRSSGRSATATFLVRTSWAKFHFDDRNSGYNPYENVLSASNVSGLRGMWSYPTGGGESSPAVVGGVLYVGSYDHRVYALDSHTGEKLWDFPTGRSITSTPAVHDGVVYIGSRDHYVYALDATTGTMRWRFHAPHWVGSSPAVAGGVVYLESATNFGDRGAVVALDASTGLKIWSFKTQDW
jgi:outer membrane protein assembly factor BamB